MKYNSGSMTQAQFISVLLLRAQQGTHAGSFAQSPISTREGYVALVGNVPEEFTGMITVQTAEGPVEIPAAGLPCTIALPEWEYEELNHWPLNAYVVSGNAVVSMNTKTESRNTKYGNNKKLQGSLWIEPTEEFDAAPSAGRAISKQAVLDSLENARQNRAEYRATRAAAHQVQTATQNQNSKTGTGVSAS